MTSPTSGHLYRTGRQPVRLDRCWYCGGVLQSYYVVDDGQFHIGCYHIVVPLRQSGKHHQAIEGIMDE